jgi:hypothetical protein
MRIRWYAWVLAFVPLVAGVWSLQAGDGDYRTSGFMAGLGLTLGVIAVLLVFGRPWRHSSRPWGWLSMVAVVLVGVVGALALVGGLPDFLRERGLSVDTDSYGPRAVVAINGGFVVVGDHRQGAVVWYSEDASHWNQARHVPLFDGLEMRDAVAFDGGVLAVGQPADEAEAVVLTSLDGRMWALESRFGNDESGISPEALSVSGGHVILVADTIGNDVAFVRGSDPATLGLVDPMPVSDDGEEIDDVACRDLTCVAVGKDLATNSGVVWTSTAGEEWFRVDGDFARVPLIGVGQSNSGFVVAGTDPDEDRAVLWRSSDAVEWERIEESGFANSAVDGVDATSTGYVIFGRDLTTDAVVIWLSTDGLGWEKVTVDDSLGQGSAIRSILNTGGRWIAVGINTDIEAAVMWTSLDGVNWEAFDVIE